VSALLTLAVRYNLFVKLVSESFYTPVQLATRIMPLKLSVCNKIL